MDSDKESNDGTPGPEEPIEEGDNVNETAEEVSVFYLGLL
jgi:hypothetical protein